jgi:hypothetical protein
LANTGASVQEAITRLDAVIASHTALEDVNKRVVTLQDIKQELHTLSLRTKEEATKKDLLDKLDSLITRASDVKDYEAKIQRLTLLGSSINQLAEFNTSLKEKSEILDNNLCPMCHAPLGGHTH